MLARSSDGYKSFSLAELDPRFLQIELLFWQIKKDGKPLADGVGPFRLVGRMENTNPHVSAHEVII